MLTLSSLRSLTGANPAPPNFICTTTERHLIPAGFAVVSSLDLPVLVSVLALGMAFVIAVDQFFQRIGTPQPVRVQPVRRRA
jgi:hypothetical protein